MNQQTFLRVGAVSLALVVAAGSLMVGCSDSSDAASTDADSGAPSNGVDSGTGPTADSGAAASDAGSTAVDGASDASTGPQGILIDVVHASPDTAQVGLCLGAVVGGNVTFPSPFDKVQGPLPRNAATQITVPTALQGAIGGVEVRVYLVPGYSAPDAGAPSCASVTAPDAGSALLLKAFPAQTFKPGKGYLIAATGCSNAGAATVAKCGADATTPTNPRALTAYFKELDRTVTESDSLGAQFVHLAPQAESKALPVPDAGNVAVFANGLKVAVGVPAADAGNVYSWVSYVTGNTAIKAFDDPGPRTFGPMPVDPNTLGLGLFTAAAPASPNGQTPVATLPMSFVAAATLGATNPAVATYFKKGITYTFIALGDLGQSANPQASNAGPDFFRVVALPNNP